MKEAENRGILVQAPAVLLVGFASVGIQASALSQLNSRVDRGKFAAGVADLHLPVDAALGAVDIV